MAQENHSPAYGRRRALLACCLLPFFAGVTGCSRPADEQALRDTIEAMRSAVQSRDGEGVIRHLADDFAGPGGMDRDGLRRLLLIQFLRNQSVGVTLGPLTTRIEGGRAEAEFRALLTGFDQGLLPSRAEGYLLRTVWRVESGKWLLEYASWD